MRQISRLLARTGVCRLFLAMLVAGTAGQGAHAQLTSTTPGGLGPTIDFELYLADICANLDFFTPLDDPTLQLCAQTFPGGGAGAAGVPGAGSTVTNLGTTAAQAQSSLAGFAQQRGALGSQLGGADAGGGASADWTVGRLTLFAALQSGDTDRKATTLEQGYDGDLRGGMAGLDYRITDALSAGASLGYTRNDSRFDNNGGTLENTSQMGALFVSWLPMTNLSFGAYLGYASQDYDSVRPIAAGPVTGRATSGFDGSNRVAGASVGYDLYFDRSSVGVFGNLDYAKTRIDGYQEAGTTGLEMLFNSQSEKSFTSTIGARGSHSFGFSWGSLTPEVRAAWVHEFEKDSRNITGALVLAPTSAFTLTTDSPDRDYFTGSLGMAAQLNAGPVLFANYERWAGHSYLDSWTVNVGALLPF